MNSNKTERGKHNSNLYASHKIILLIFTILFSLTQCKIKKIPEDQTISDLTELERYGRYIFNRENCIKCHVFKDELVKRKKISLDGISEKYSDYLMQYLIRPKNFAPNSSKKSYEYLNYRFMDYSLEIGTDRVQKLNSAKDRFLINALKQSKELAGKFEFVGVPIQEGSELIALYAYLRTIPKTPFKTKMDSIKNEKLNRKYEMIDQIVLDSNSIVFKTALKPSNIKKGKKVFGSYCEPCHGKNAEGRIGPNLTDSYWIHGNKELEIAQVIFNGVLEKGMLGWKYELGQEEIGQLVAYIKSLRNKNPIVGKAPQGIKIEN